MPEPNFLGPLLPFRKNGKYFLQFFLQQKNSWKSELPNDGNFWKDKFLAESQQVITYFWGFGYKLHKRNTHVSKFFPLWNWWKYPEGRAFWATYSWNWFNTSNSVWTVLRFLWLKKSTDQGPGVLKYVHIIQGRYLVEYSIPWLLYVWKKWLHLACLLVYTPFQTGRLINR